MTFSDQANGQNRTRRIGSLATKFHASYRKRYMYYRGCQIGMRGPQLCAGPLQFCKLDVPSSRIAFLGLKLLVLQLGTKNSNN